MFKNKFVIIIGLSIITLALLIVGSINLYKDNSLTFSSDGYILSTTVSTDNKYYFSANTKYKKNVDDNITFTDKETNSVSVDPASFVHYSNGSITFLKKGAIVNLSELTNPIISYYNVTNDNIIEYNNGGYLIETNDKTVSIDSFVGRISDDKYIVAGQNLSLKVPDQTEEIEGNYFEVLFIEDGIVKIYNELNSFQVTAQGSYFYIGNDIIINLGDGKISYDGEVKMLLSQITINGDENIDLVVKNSSNGGGSGDGDGSGEGVDGENTNDGSDTETNNEDESNTSVDDNGTGENDNNEESDNTSNGTDGNNEVIDNAMIELVSANVTTTSLNIKLLLNNASSIKGKLMAYITNVSTGNDVAFTIDNKESNEIELKNGTFDIVTSDTDAVDGTREFHLNPDTDYLLRIVSVDGSSSNQYFQKIFRTNSLGISLEKVYATEDTLKYKVNFDDNSSVVDVYLNIQGEGISTNKKISINDNVTEVEFNNLKSNTNYSVFINNVTINENGNAGVTYASRYNISRIDSTLKQTPSAIGKVVNVATDTDNARFTIKLNNISDPDNSIIAYTYEVYLNDENGDTIYSVTKNVNSTTTDSNDASELILSLSDIDAMSSGVSYKCRVIVSYNNNEMTREVEFDDSDVFSLKSIPSINWNADDFVIGKYTVSGTINLIDASCTIPLKGRSCSDNNSNYDIKDTVFTLKYYVVGEEEKDAKEVNFRFNSNKLTYDFDLDMLLSNSNYIMKVYGSYYDDNFEYHKDVMLGSSVYFTTAKSDNLSLVINSINNSNDTDVVNFSMHLDKGTSTESYEEKVTSVTINLYSGAYNNSDKLIGTYNITDRTTIEDLFNNLTITNGLFDNVTNFPIAASCNNKLCNRDALISVTNNSTNTLNNSYTIEVASVKVGQDKLVVENPIYTFVLTSSYYLDARISANTNYKYITVDEIKKSDLTDDEIDTLKNEGVSNIDDLLDDTVVGLKVSNRLSDLFVDSAFSYEKAVVNYTIHNKKTDKDVKIINVDMGNKYQPSEQTIWLDLTDTKDGFIRGYTYDVGYTIDFTIDTSGLTSDEDKNIVTYDNTKLHQSIDINKQKPVFTQYISTSSINSITYKYSMTDIDNSLYDKEAYYSYVINEDGTEKTISKVSSDKFITDGEFHSVTFPIDVRVDYTFGYHNKKLNDGGSALVEMDSYTFDSEYYYNDEVGFSLINDVYDNKLKIKLEKSEVNDRAVAYRVVLTAPSTDDYDKVFLSSKLEKYGDEPGNGSEDDRSKYIAIDYANISKFMNKNITVKLYAYYDSGLVGLEQNFDNALNSDGNFKSALIIKDIINNKYLNIHHYTVNNSISSKTKISNNIMGVYFPKSEFNTTDNSIELYNLLVNSDEDASSNNAYSNNVGTGVYKNLSAIGNGGVTFNVSYSNQGVVFNDGKTNYTKYNFKVVKTANMVTKDSSYKFESITPKISVKTVNTINSFTIKMTASGIYSDTQFMKNNSSDNNIYIEVYSDEECTNKITNLISKIDLSGDINSGYSATIENVTMNNLKPDTNYYFKIFAYMNNEYTQLYDDAASTSKYVSKIYNTKTLNGSEILSRINFSVKPSAYNGEISTKTLIWRLGLKSLDNYKIRFELYRPDGFETTTNSEGEEVEVTKYKAVMFDGTDAVDCSNTSNGTSSNGYVNGCYISISKDDINTINTKDQTYTFSTNDFVFGGNYYKMLVYAIPYTNGDYVEDDKVILYETDALTSTGGDISTGGISYKIDIPSLKEPEFNLNDFESGYDDTLGYYVSFVPTSDDKILANGNAGSFVIKNGVYTASLIDEKGNTVATNSNVSAGNANGKVIFDNLNPDKLYSVELSYSTYRNNVGYTESEKVATTPYIDYIYTPSSELGIRLGSVTPQKVSSSQIQLIYSGAINLTKKIIQVNYTITLKGGSGSKNTGTYKIDNSNNSIFSVERDNVVLNINFADADNEHSTNTSFTLISGQTYIINTQYYYLNNGTLTLYQENTSQLNA